MTDHTRRNWLRTVGMGVSGVAIHSTTTGTDDAQAARFCACDGLVPDTAVPDRFTQYPEPASTRIFDVLADEAPEPTDADTAASGYWDGDTEENPHWILSSMALVADDTLPRATIESAARQSTDEYVAEYNAETGPTIDFEQSHTRGDRATEWRVDLLQKPILANDSKDLVPLFTDLMRLQFFDNVALGTVVFGPRTEPPGLTAMLDQIATHQRVHYRVHGANP